MTSPQSLIERALELAAQCWCDPETEHLVMIPELCEAFAKRLTASLAENAALKEIIMLESNLCIKVMAERDRAKAALDSLWQIANEDGGIGYEQAEVWLGENADWRSHKGGVP